MQKYTTFWHSLIRSYPDVYTSLSVPSFYLINVDCLNDIYNPYRKPDNKPLYINKHSSHPLNILKQLPKSIEKPISETSSNIDVFNRSTKIYSDGLHESNFKEALKF